MVRLIPESTIKYQGRRLEGACSEAALRKGSSPRRPRPALQLWKRSDAGWGIALRGSLNTAYVRFAKRIFFQSMKQCSACRGARAASVTNSGTGIPEGLVPQPTARVGWGLAWAARGFGHRRRLLIDHFPNRCFL